MAPAPLSASRLPQPDPRGDDNDTPPIDFIEQGVARRHFELSTTANTQRVGRRSESAPPTDGAGSADHLPPRRRGSGATTRSPWHLHGLSRESPEGPGESRHCTRTAKRVLRRSPAEGCWRRRTRKPSCARLRRRWCGDHVALPCCGSSPRSRRGWPTMVSGLTMRWKSTAETPSASAASRRVLPSLSALCAIASSPTARRSPPRHRTARPFRNCQRHAPTDNEHDLLPHYGRRSGRSRPRNGQRPPGGPPATYSGLTSAPGRSPSSPTSAVVLSQHAARRARSARRPDRLADRIHRADAHSEGRLGGRTVLSARVDVASVKYRLFSPQ
jgi:hypothetical protein